SLSFSSVNFDEEFLSIKNKPGKRTKNGRERHIFFNHEVRNVLSELRRQAVDPDGPIFQMGDGSSWLPHKRVLQQQFAEIVRAAGLYSDDPTTNVTIHTLRHTFGSWLAIEGIPLRKIQYLLGHTSIKTTERYMHLSPAETRGDTNVLMREVATNWQQAATGSE